MSGIGIAVFCMLCIIITDIIYVLIRLVKLIICKDVEDCRNRKCCANRMCSKYNRQLTKEEYNRLRKLIEDSFTEKTR